MRLIKKLRTEYPARSEEAVKTAHELKGLARAIGADELGTLSEQAEESARLGRWDDFTARLPELDAAHRRLAEAVLALGDDIAGSE